MNTSSINFESASKSVELGSAAAILEHWLQQSPNLTYFTFDQISRELANQIPAEQFNKLLLRLVAEGELVVKYLVKVGEGEYSEEQFDSLEEIPECVFDSAFEPVEVDDDAKIPAYVPAK